MAMASGCKIEKFVVTENLTGGDINDYLLEKLEGHGDCMIVSPTYAGKSSSLYNLVFILYENGAFTSGINSSYNDHYYQGLTIQDGLIAPNNIKPGIYSGMVFYILPISGE